jgi:hypothetical protein
VCVCVCVCVPAHAHSYKFNGGGQFANAVHADTVFVYMRLSIVALRVPV